MIKNSTKFCATCFKKRNPSVETEDGNNRILGSARIFSKFDAFHYNMVRLGKEPIVLNFQENSTNENKDPC